MQTPNPQPLPPRTGEGEPEGLEEAFVGGWKTDGILWAKLRPLAREMRNTPTVAEDALWQRLRRNQLGVKFRRQFAIERFVTDFYSREARLNIEVDGSIHQFIADEDAIRQSFLEAQGLRVLRFSNDEVLHNIAAVVQKIRTAINNNDALNPPPLAGRDFQSNLGSASLPLYAGEGSGVRG